MQYSRGEKTALEDLYKSIPDTILDEFPDIVEDIQNNRHRPIRLVLETPLFGRLDSLDSILHYPTHYRVWRGTSKHPPQNITSYEKETSITIINTSHTMYPGQR